MCLLGDERHETAEWQALALLPKPATGTMRLASGGAWRGVTADVHDKAMFMVQRHAAEFDTRDEGHHAPGKLMFS